jgi:hypothetical protein
MSYKNGLSMVEIMVSVVIIALATGPLIGVLSSSNKMSNASIYEEMAIHYGRELADQLLRLNPQLSDIVDDARIMTGDSSIKLDDILNDSGFQNRLENHGTTAEAIPLQISGAKLPVRIIASALDKAFTRRRVSLESLPTSTNVLLNTGKYWKAKIELAWIDKNSGRSEPRNAIMVVFLSEN